VDLHGYEWERRAEEPPLWFDRFERYRLAGAARSLLGTYNAEAARHVSVGRAGDGGTKRTSVPGAWDKAAARWQWKKRAEAWDAHLRAESDRRAEQLILERERVWREREEAYRERRWKLTEKLQEKLEGMLAFPLAQVETKRKEVDEEGRLVNITQIIKPAGWRLRDVAVLMRQADQSMKWEEREPGEEFEEGDIDAAIERELARVAAESAPPDAEEDPDAGSDEEADVP
jgi:hypothetical protein